jgi:hypothetical protein
LRHERQSQQEANVFPINLRHPAGGDHHQDPWTNIPDQLLATLSSFALAFCLAMIAVGLLGFWLKSL